MSSSSGAKGAGTSKESDSKMNVVTIVAIVGGIVVGVSVLAFIVVAIARRRRDDDDDPLSPFELSMDKGYNGAPTFNNQQNNNGGGNAGLAYTGARTATNNAGAIGGAGGAMYQNQNQYQQNQYQTQNQKPTPADVAGVTYTQFYDVPTSPYHHQQHTTQTLASKRTDSSDDANTNDSNLWMSAMEPKDAGHHDLGASVPPDVSLPDDKNLSFMSSNASRNSYDQVNDSIDIDQSSVLSGGSDLEKDFPDYEDESSRGSYEL